MNNRSAQFLRKRKFYLALPLLVLPFVTLAFWAMGGGKGQTEEMKNPTGLNLQLPDAKLKDDKSFDKLSFYDEADKDSVKLRESMKEDPNYKPEADTALNVVQLISKPANNGEYKNVIQSPYSNTGVNANEQKIYSKINELNKQISQPYVPASQIFSGEQKDINGKDLSVQVDKLQNMMQTMNDKPGKDPEVEQLSGMLDKIMDIQHPDRIKEIKEKSAKNKQQIFSVQSSVKTDNISLMESGRKTDTIKTRVIKNNFYDLNAALTNEEPADHAIEAVIHELQTIVAGSTVKLRLTTNIYVNGILIPKDNFIYGTASLDNERLIIVISSVRYANNLFPVSLEVYDLDGMKGIYVPGSISKDALKESAQQSMQGVELASLDPSVAAQVTTAGISAAKNLLSKKSKMIKVTLKAGYKVLLKDNNKNN